MMDKTQKSSHPEKLTVHISLKVILFGAVNIYNISRSQRADFHLEMLSVLSEGKG
jgi:hypothetical protein